MFIPSTRTKFTQIEDDIAHVFHDLVSYLSSMQEDKMKIILNIIVVLILISPLAGQNITVTAEPDLADWDFLKLAEMLGSYGLDSPLIYGIRIEADQYPVNDVTISASLLDVTNAFLLDDPILFSASVTIDLLAPITINNKQLSYPLESGDIQDDAGNIISFRNPTYSYADPLEIQQKIIDNDSELPVGTYRLTRIVTGGTNVQYIGFDRYRDITITGSSDINLISPSLGAQIADGEMPFFSWQSTGCEEYYIKICEYNPIKHGSPEDAIQDESVYPYPSTGDYAYVGSATTLDFSAVSAKPLEVGKAYAWQVKKICKSMTSNVPTESLVYGFVVAEVGQTITPCQEQIRSAIGDANYNILFGSHGALSGFDECGEATLDSEPISESDLSALIQQFIQGAYTIDNITTQ